ncbi:Methylenetetrahydrofolate reductase [Peptostreptococcus sp. D1]|nr:Methylenetetrahydrofolate reductase [Peptostreptococcus sp. D1]
MSFDEAYDIFKQQMVVGEESGADLIVIETMTDLYEVKAAILVAKENTSLPVFCTMTFEKNKRTFTGCSLEAFAATVEGLGVDAFGINCSLGPDEIFPMAKILSEISSTPLIVKANAGLPNLNTGKYDIDENDYAVWADKIAQLGVKYIGGCCGTTPSHIEKLSNNLKKHRIQSIKDEKPQVFKVRTKPSSNVFYDKLCGGKKVIAIELDPPADVDIEKYIKSLKSLKELDVDAVTIADCPVGRARIDSSLMAYKIKNEVGLEPVVHLTCRDRNLNATKALLLGLNIENIRNLIVVTGDPIPTAEKVE